MTITLNGEKQNLWQWDTDQYIETDAPATEIHFKVSSGVISVPVEGGRARIPDSLLQNAKPIQCYLYDGHGTILKAQFNVRARPRPPGYVYTESEANTWVRLEERLARLEDGSTITPGFGLEFDPEGKLAVKTVEKIEEANNLPASSSAVAAYVGEIDTALAQI